MTSPSTRPRLFVVTGLPGSGKTTLASPLAASLGAVRMCPDEWMLAAGIDLWDADARARIEELQGELAMDVLATGRSVVIEWGTWSRQERDALRDAARSVGAAVELRPVSAPVEELWRRIVERDREGRVSSRAITRAELDDWVHRYEVPSPEELATYDPPLPGAVVHWEGPGLDAWEAWTPGEVASRLAEASVPWMVVGGWAIDLFLGEQTRPHDDLEVAVLRGDLHAVRRLLDGFELYSVGDGVVRRLPVGRSPRAGNHQNWVLDPAARRWRADVMLEPGDHETWVFRRDPAITADRRTMQRRTADGVPYLAPAGVLLFKAKAARPKDEADLEACLPRLAAAERAWLSSALRVVHPGHPWIERLA